MKKYFYFLGLIFLLTIFCFQTTYARNYYDMEFRPDGNFVALAIQETVGAKNLIEIYRFDKTTGQITGSPLCTANTTQSYITKISWDHTGQFLAAGSYNPTGAVDIYEFNESTLVSRASQSFNSSVNCVKFAPIADEDYIAVGLSNGLDDNTQIFSFVPHSPFTFSSVASFDIGGTTDVTALAWSTNYHIITSNPPTTLPLFLAVGSHVTGPPDTYYLNFFRFDRAPYLLTNFANNQTYEHVYTIDWNPEYNSNYLAVGTDINASTNVHGIIIYKYELDLLNLLIEDTEILTSISAAWSPDGKYLFTGGILPIFFYFDKNSGTAIPLLRLPSSEITKTCWSSDGRYWGACGTNNALATGWSYYKCNNLTKNQGINRPQMIRLDGTSNVYYTELPVVFEDGDNAVGEVLLKGGFTVTNNAGIQLTINTPIFGPIDFRPTSTLDLGGDLILDSKVTFSNVGKVWGRGHTIFMTGDLSLPANSTLQFINHAALDGQGHTLILEPHAQILIDGSVTVTFKNLIIKNKINGATEPPIKCIDWYSKACFDNVTFALNNDYWFSNGQMFIHNDVEFTGTSQFSYRSAQPSYIAQHSNLIFNTNTTFEYYPNSPDNSLIKMIDHTSAIILDGSTLQTTHTGIKLIKGSLYLDNKVTLSTAANTLFYLETHIIKNYALPGGSLRTFSWHPSGRYLAIGGYQPTTASAELQIYSFINGIISDLPTDTKPYDSLLNSLPINSVAWSPDGKYLALGSTNLTPNTQLRIYSFNANTGLLSSTPIAQASFGPSNDVIENVTWHPNGQYLAVVGLQIPGNSIQIYSFTGGILTLSDQKNYSGAHARGASWNSSGTYLAICGSNFGTDNLLIYSFNTGTGLLSIAPTDQKNLPSNITFSTTWSPDENYLAIGGFLNPALNIFSFNSDTGLLSASPTAQRSYSNINSMAWSPDGNYLSIGGSTGATAPFEIYSFYSGNLSTNPIIQTYPGSEIFTMAWHADENYLAVGNGRNLTLYTTLYRFNTTPQGFLNSIIFGDGNPENDLDINVAPGASINLKCGKLAYLNSN